MTATRRVVLSGCSGGGKSTLLAAMAARGWAVCLEPGRRVVEAELATGGSALPWRDEQAFARRCVALCLADLAQPAEGEVLHDRSLIDAVAALSRMGAARTEDTALLDAYRYDETVFLAPPWPEIFAGDMARRHGFDAALAEYEDLLEAYPRAGYTIVEAPQLPPAERAQWFAAALRSSGGTAG